MKSLGRPYSNITGALMRRGNLETQNGPREAHAQRKDNMRTQQEDGYLQAKERDLK